MADDFDYHWNKSEGKTYVSKRITPLRENGRPIRIASKVIDVAGGYAYAKELEEIVLRQVPSGRHEIVAKFTEDDRHLHTLTVQKFNKKSGPSEGIHFSFVGDEIEKFLEFLVNVKRLHFPNSEKVNISDADLKRLLLDEDQARHFFNDNRELIERLVESEDVTKDVVAVGYRRKQLEIFKNLLSDVSFFQTMKEEQQIVSSEALWQKFFEKNKWIFGYGLSFVFFTGLDRQNLQQNVSGATVASVGKRADALLKTQASISALCYVEIKRHDTRLLSPTEYRSGAWPPSTELAGGVAQSQATVQASVEDYSRKLEPTDLDGNPTGETLFNFEPRSVLVVGSLDEFQSETGLNENKYRSFELYRRNLHNPEIITFDELFHRAKFIVEHNS